MHDIIYINDELVPSKNSEGGRIYSTADEIEAFYEWFDSSTMLDQEGRPRLMYHGTTAQFSSFESAADGIFFSSDLEQAKAYAGAGGRVVAAYLKSHQPYLTDEKTLNTAGGLIARDMLSRGYDGFMVDYADGFDFAVFDSEQVRIYSDNILNEALPIRQFDGCPVVACNM